MSCGIREGGRVGGWVGGWVGVFSQDPGVRLWCAKPCNFFEGRDLVLVEGELNYAISYCRVGYCLPGAKA